LVEGFEHLVKNVEVALDTSLRNNARFFEQIIEDRRRLQSACAIEVNLNKFSEPRRVIVLESFSIAKSLKQWVRIKHLFFDRGLLIAFLLTVSVLIWLFVK
jgi:hypothetical protein